MSDLRDRLRDDFRDFEYRHDYTESFLNSSLASQIRALRKARDMTQKELALALDTTQSGVSAFEDASHEGWQIGTLQKLARAFDVALVVRFESFGNVLGEIGRFGPAALNKPSFDRDPAFRLPSTTETAEARTNILPGPWVHTDSVRAVISPSVNVAVPTAHTADSGYRELRYG
jgi:transcriptional regulator with XRE-family HTH domain